MNSEITLMTVSTQVSDDHEKRSEFEGMARLRYLDDPSRAVELALQITRTSHQTFLVTIGADDVVDDVSDTTARRIEENLAAHLSGQLNNEYTVAVDIA